MNLSVMLKVAMTTSLIFAITISSVSVVYSKHINRKYYSALQKMQSIQDKMNIEWGQWQLERSTFATSSQIERSARKNLGMTQPLKNQLKVLRP